MGRLAQLSALSRIERRQLFVSALVLPGAAVLLRIFGLRRVLRWGERRTAKVVASKSATSTPGEWIAATVRSAAIAARRGPFEMSCLPRSVTVWWLLRRRGVPAEMRIGVKKEDDALRAHAWVELKGELLTDPETVRDEFYRFEQDVAAFGSRAR